MNPRMDPQRCSLPVAQWPDTDRVLWEHAIRALDAPSLVDRLLMAAPRPLAMPSRRKYRQAWGRFLGWLDRTGQLVATENPGQRARPERIAAFVDMHVELGNCGNTIAGYLDSMAGALRMMRFPAEASRVAAPGGVPIRARVDCEPRQVEVFHPKVLYRWALALLRGANAQGTALARQRAIRDGLLIAMLAARAFRSRTVHVMMLPDHLHEADGVWSLRFGREDVKNRQPIAYPLPRSLQPWVDRYLGIERRELLRGNDSCALWISIHGDRLSQRGLDEIVHRRSAERFGEARAFQIHRFRYGVATIGAVADPADSLLGAKVLSITSRIAREHYERGQDWQAGQRYGDSLQQERARTGPLAASLFARRRRADDLLAARQIDDYAPPPAPTPAMGSLL